MKLKHKLSATWLIITLFPLLALSFYLYSNIKKEITVTLGLSLNHISEYKTKQIEWFFNDIHEDTLSLAGGHAIYELIEGAQSVEVTKHDLSIDYKMMFSSKTYYREVLVINPHGQLLLSLGFDHNLSQNNNYFNAKRLSQGMSGYFITDIFKEGQNYFMIAYAPIRKDKKVLGVVALKVSMDFLYKFIQDRTGLGETGETLIGKKEGDRLVFINKVRHGSFQPLEFNTPINLLGIAQPLQKAVAGKEGFGEANDYRGTPVLASWRYIPNLNWGLVTKIDQDEAFFPIYKIQKIIFISITVTILLIIFSSFLMSQKILSPLSELKNATKAIGEGKFNISIENSSRDEIGELLMDFNHMAVRLKDVTASRDELNKTKMELERSNRELEQFAYVASHDLQEPLRTISSYGDIIVEDYNAVLDDKGRNYLSRIKKASVRMKDLIEGLLQYSRIGRDKLVLENVNLEWVLENVKDDLQDRIRNAKAKVEIIGKFPIVLADRRQMHQLFQNLIGNALKFSKSGVAPIVCVQFHEEDESYSFKVSDNGVGFAPENAEKIFEPFRRLHGQDQYAGTGIGLSICQKIVLQHNGTISATGKVGEGAEIKFTLPKSFPL